MVHDGAIPIGDVSATAALDDVERLLNIQRKSNITRGARTGSAPMRSAPTSSALTTGAPTTDADMCSYADPVWMVFFGPGWPAMAQYNAGRFWVEQGAEGRQLHYALNARYRVVYAAVFMVFLAALGLATYAPGPGVFYILVAYIALLVGQWFLDRYRIPAALRKAVSG